MSNMRFSRSLLLMAQTPCYRTTFVVISPQNFRATLGKEPSPLCALIVQSAPTFSSQSSLFYKRIPKAFSPHVSMSCPSLSPV